MARAGLTSLQGAWGVSGRLTMPLVAGSQTKGLDTMNKHRLNTFIQLGRLGISSTRAATLVRCSAVLHTWAEHECNGAIQRDEDTDKPYWHSTYDGKRIGLTPDRETGARKSVESICAFYNLTPYFQTDPRGCALYLLRPGDVPKGGNPSAYYSRGIAVVP